MKGSRFEVLTMALLLLALSVCQKAEAQLNPMGSLYFQNQYSGNAAMAGSTGGINFHIGYRKQWTSIPGSPTVQTFTNDYALNDKAGFGINIYNDKAGLVTRTRTVVSYAYHLPLNGKQQTLSFGISLGFMNERLREEDVQGDDGDLTIGNYNQRGTYMDGDFGVAYTGNKLNIQLALPNMKSIFRKDFVKSFVDRSTFFSGISYKMQLTEPVNGLGVEPKICFRGVKGFDSILDAGVNFSHEKTHSNLFGMYHTSGSTTWGLGFNYQSVTINGMYTTATAALGAYANGNFEIGLQVKLRK